MQVFEEIWAASIALWNLPFTVMLFVVLFYWGFVLLGIFDLNTGDASLETDAGMDGGVEAELTADGGMDGGAESDVSAEADVHADGVEAEGGDWLHSTGHFLHVGAMPVMVPLSLLSLCLWTLGVLSTHYLNPAGRWGLALALTGGNLLVSAVLTRYLGWPLRWLFAALNKDYDQAGPVVGRICRVTTGEVNPVFGQATLETRGSPITLSVRTTGDEVLHRGDEALVIQHDKKSDSYRITRFKNLKLEE
jgi:hypothetical protein